MKQILRICISSLFVLGMLLTVNGCMSMGPNSVVSGPQFELKALQRASMAEAAAQLDFDPQGDKSKMQEKEDKTIWSYLELMESSGGAFSGESSMITYDFYFNADDELYFVKIIHSYTNSSNSARRSSANAMKKQFGKMADSFSRQLGIEPEVIEVTDTMDSYRWKTDMNIGIESGVDDDYEEGFAVYGVVTEIHFYKPE